PLPSSPATVTVASSTEKIRQLLTSIAPDRDQSEIHRQLVCTNHSSHVNILLKNHKVILEWLRKLEEPQHALWYARTQLLCIVLFRLPHRDRLDMPCTSFAITEFICGPQWQDIA